MDPPEQVECEHLGRMIYPGECSLCSGAAKKLQEEMDKAIDVKFVFKAKTGGYMHNNYCLHYVKPGETIVCLTDGCYVCKECGERFR